MVVTCASDRATLRASGGNGTYTWSPDIQLSSTTGATVVAGPLANMQYTVTSQKRNLFETQCPGYV